MKLLARLPGKTGVAPSCLFTLIAIALSGVVSAADPTELALESLLNSTISSASKYEQKVGEVPAAVSVITRDDIRAFGWRTLQEALSSLPGVHSTYDYQYHYLGVRGLGLPGDFNTRILLLINGNRMNDVVYDGAQVGREFPIDMDLIERIEYISGPGGAVYGQNAMFAVVNIITRSGFQVDGSEMVLVGSEPQDQQELALRWGKRLESGIDLLFSASGLRSDGENLLLTFPGQALDGSDLVGRADGLDRERDQEFFAALSHGPWSVNVAYGERKKDDPTAAYFSDPFAEDVYSDDRYLISQLQYQQNYFDDALDVQGRLFTGRQRYLGTAEYSGFGYNSTAASNWEGAELRLVYRALQNHVMLLGVEGQNNSRADQATYDFANAGAELLIPSQGYRAGVYVQDEWQFSPRWRTTVGARVDRNNVTGTKASPRVGLIWQATDKTALKALFGRAWRAPNAYESLFGDGTTLLANLQLKGERNDTLEMLVEHQLTNGISFRASVYQWDIQHLITLGIDPLTGVPVYENSLGVESQAFELAMNGTWSSGARLWASIAYQDVGYEEGGVVANSPTELAKVAYAVPLPALGVRIAWELQYDGERQTLAGRSVGGDWLSHAVVSSLQAWQGLSWSLALRNMFDRDYELPAADTNWQDALQQQGRQLRLIVNYRF